MAVCLGDSAQSLLAVFISGMKSVPNGASRLDMYSESLLVTTPGRELRLTAGNKEQHETWVNVSTLWTRASVVLADIMELQGLSYLISKPSQATMSGSASFIPVETLTTPVRRDVDEFGRRDKFQSSRSLRSYVSENATPKATEPRSQSAMSVRGSTHKNKRPGTVAHEYLLRVENGLPPANLMGRDNSGIGAGFDEIARAEAIEVDGHDYDGVDNVRGRFRLIMRPVVSL